MSYSAYFALSFNDNFQEPADANLDGEPDIDVGGSIIIPGSVKASGLLTPSELLSEVRIAPACSSTTTTTEDFP